MDLKEINIKIKQQINALITRLDCAETLLYVATEDDKAGDYGPYLHFAVTNADDKLIDALTQGLGTIFARPVEVYSKEFLQEQAALHAGTRVGELYEYDVQHLKPLMPLLSEPSKFDSDFNPIGG